MTNLRLKKIPDRTPVKLTISIVPKTHEDLLKYTKFYKQEHGVEETPQVIASHMIMAFIQGDAGFKKAKQSLKLKSCSNKD